MTYNPNDIFSKKSTAFTGEVKTTFDPRVITKKKPMSNKEIEDYKREAVKGTSIGSKMANFGLSSSMGKDDRLFALKSGVVKGRIKTIAQASKLLNVTDTTVKKYLKELSIEFNSDTGSIAK